MRERETSGTDWARIGLQVGGPLATLAMVLAFDILTRRGAAVPGPFVLLLVPVVWSASRGGLRPGILSAVFVMLYSLHYYSRAGSPLTYSGTGTAGVIAVLLAAPAAAILAGTLRQRALDGSDAGNAPGPQAAPMFIDAPLPAGPVGSIATAAARYASTVMADWCTVYLADDAQRLRCAAAAHRDPARAALMEEMQRLAGRTDGRVTPAGVWGGGTPALLEVDASALAALADTPDELRIYQSLAPAQLITVPLIARGRNAGVLELGNTVPWDDRERAVAAAHALATRIAEGIDGVRLARAVEDAERRYRMLFESHPNPMWVFDAESLVFLDVNDSAVRHYGYSRDEFLRMTIMDVIPDEEEPGMLRSTERAPASREGVAMARHQKKDGSAIDVEIVSHALVFAGRPARLALVTDVTDRARTRIALHQSEEQLRKAQKMDAVGRLASGVAHDFNNILTA
ncbi:MAG: PAS domain S-box protein, partial [Gemmatimonadales bacterium]|nr:PAS domain S-box protein [Gemmatimonadales bacterium]